MLRQIALLIGLFNLLGHTISPHGHETHTEPSFCQCSHESSGLATFLRSFFHPDLGEDHLEEYVNADLDLNFFVLTRAQEPLTPPHYKSPPVYEGDFFMGVSLVSTLLRGPPYSA